MYYYHLHRDSIRYYLIGVSVPHAASQFFYISHFTKLVAKNFTALLISGTEL